MRDGAVGLKPDSRLITYLDHRPEQRLRVRAKVLDVIPDLQFFIHATNVTHVGFCVKLTLPKTG